MDEEEKGYIPAGPLSRVGYFLDRAEGQRNRLYGLTDRLESLLGPDA